MIWIKIKVFRFAVIAIISNLVLYCIYIGLTNLKIDYKLGMTLVYIIGILQSFILNKNFTFKNKENKRKTIHKYIILYIAIYSINLILLYVLVEYYNCNHLIAQGVLIVISGLFSFIVQDQIIFKIRK